MQIRFLILYFTSKKAGFRNFKKVGLFRPMPPGLGLKQLTESPNIAAKACMDANLRIKIFYNFSNLTLLLLTVKT
jgi:hypothetical protein